MNRIIFWLSAAAFIIVAIMRVTDPLLPVIANDFGLTVGRASIIVTAFAIPYGLFQLAYGLLGDGFGKLPIIVYAMFASTIVTLLCTFANSIESLTVFRVLSGVATAAVVPLSLALIADHIPYEGRQPVIARYLSGIILGQILGGSLGGIVAELFGWRLVFAIFGTAVGALTVFVWQFSRHHQERRSARPLQVSDLYKPYCKLLGQTHVRHVIVTAAIEGIFFFGAAAFIGALLHARFAMNYMWVGLMLACFGIGSLLYSYTARHVVALLGERGMIIAGSLVMSATYIALPMAPNWQFCIPILIVSGFGFYVMHNTMQTLATELAPESRGTAVALFAFALITGQGLGAAAIGKIIDFYGYDVAFGIAGVAIAVLGLWFQSKLRGLHARS